MNSHKLPSNKNFGVIFFIFFLLVGLYYKVYFAEIKIWVLVVALLFLVLGLLNSKILTPLNKLWFNFGILLGKIVSPLIMGIIFFLIVTPIGLLLKILGKDILKLSYDDGKTYWIEKNSPISNMKKQF